MTNEEANALARALNCVPDILVQLPDNESPLRMHFEAYGPALDGKYEVIGFPRTPPHAGKGAVWDTAHNINNWISDPHAPKETNEHE
jgi:hypothetical protein